MAIRYRQRLRQRYQIICGALGLLTAVVGGSLLLPLLCLPFYPEEMSLAWGFLVPGLLLVLAGLLSWKRFPPRGAASLTVPEGSVIVVLAWLIAILASTTPFIWLQGLNFSQAMFESTSGWTTTGLSVVDVTQASKIILLFRSIIELLGGAGLAIVTLSAFASFSSFGFSAAEGRTDQLAPNVRRSAKLVMALYSGYAAVGTVGLKLAGMNWFDAVNHSFAALSTGGFSTRTDSIGYWDSPAIEAVTIVLMLVGTLNFFTGYLLLKGQWKAVLRNGEVRLQALFLPLSALFVFLGSAATLYPTLGKAVRVSIFETISALSTTGFSTVGYGDWGSLAWLVMIGLMLIGGGTGATAGGIKQFRIYALYRALLAEVRRMITPRNTVVETSVNQGEGKQYLSDRQLLQITAFIVFYLIIFAVIAIVMASYGNSLQDCLFETASTLSTVGLSIGITSADAPTGLIWTQVIGMFMGRLEFFTVVIGLARLATDLPGLLFKQRRVKLQAQEPAVASAASVTRGR